MNISGFIAEESEAARLRREKALYVAHSGAVRDHWKSVVWMKDALERDDGWSFMEVWNSLNDDIEKRRAIQSALWHAPTKGGVWTTAERTRMREWMNEFPTDE